MTIKEIIQKLNTTIADHRGHESHFESWLTLIEGIIDAIDALKALDKQEPVAWMSEHRLDELSKGFPVMKTLTKQRVFEDDVALYTTPPQRKPLSDEEAEGVALDVMGFAVLEKEQAETALMLIRATEVAHNIKE